MAGVVLVPKRFEDDDDDEILRRLMAEDENQSESKEPEIEWDDEESDDDPDDDWDDDDEWDDENEWEDVLIGMLTIEGDSGFCQTEFDHEDDDVYSVTHSGLAWPEHMIAAAVTLEISGYVVSEKLYYRETEYMNDAREEQIVCWRYSNREQNVFLTVYNQ